MNSVMRKALLRWRQDPVAFVTQVLRDPETGEPFHLYPEQVTFLRKAFTLGTDGTLPYPEVIFAAPKKSGKTGLAAMATLYTVFVLGGPYAEGYCVANDLEQAQGRVFQAIGRMIEASPLLAHSATLTQNRITFSTGATITALPADYAGAAGANPTVTTFDELWAYTSERAHRLWDEMVPPPTRKVAVRLTVTYAGFEGESELLEGLYKQAMAGKKIGPDLYESPGLLCYWTHDLKAPWQTEEWRQQMRQQLRPNAYLRLIENRWVTGEEAFIPTEWWQQAATGTPTVADKTLPVVLGVDAGLKRDSAAVVACTWETGKVRLVAHRIFYPRRGETLDLEATLEQAIRDFAWRFHVKEVRYDPWQFQRSAQTLVKDGIPMVEYPQSLPNLTAMSTNLYELLKSGNLVAYPDDDIRLAMQRAVAVETSRGIKITKDKASHKIDVVVALAMAAQGAVETLATQTHVTPEVASLLAHAVVYGGGSGDWAQAQDARLFGGREHWTVYRC